MPDSLRGISKSADGRGARNDIETYRQNHEDSVTPIVPFD